MTDPTHTYLLYFPLPTPGEDPPNVLVCLLITEIAPGRLTATIGSGAGRHGGPAAGLVGTELGECGSLHALEEAAKKAIQEWEGSRSLAAP